MKTPKPAPPFIQALVMAHPLWPQHLARVKRQYRHHPSVRTDADRERIALAEARRVMRNAKRVRA